MKHSNLESLARNGVLSIEPWPVSKPLSDTMKELGLSQLALMATNENPLGPSPKAVEAMRNKAPEVNFYPDGPCLSLQRKLAKKLGIKPEMITLSSGADSCIRTVCNAFLNEGDEVIMADPTFPVYSIFVRAMGGKEVLVPLKEYTHDLKAMKDKINAKTKLVYICNPNNPTGSIIRKEELENFLKDLPSHLVVVLDEAYVEFVSDPSCPNGLDYLNWDCNFILMRTFSKLYGLAGLRIGYTIGDADLISIIDRVREPYVVSAMAEAAALAALDDEEFIKRVLENNRKGREILYEAFERLGLEYVSSHTNFVFVDSKQDAKETASALLKKGFMVRPGTPWKLPTCIRVTLGTEEQNRGFAKALEETLTGR